MGEVFVEEKRSKGPGFEESSLKKLETKGGRTTVEETELTDAQVRLLQAIKDTAVENGLRANAWVFSIKIAHKMGATDMVTAVAATNEKLAVLRDLGYVLQTRNQTSWSLTPKGLSVVT